MSLIIDMRVSIAPPPNEPLEGKTLTYLLPEGSIGIYHGKMHIFKTRVRKVKKHAGKRRR
jgi:hypothetical protein